MADGTGQERRQVGGRAEGGGLRRPCPGVRVHVQAGMRCLRPQGLPEWAERQVSHSCPLGSSEATPFNAFGAVPEERCKHVFTATLGLIKGFSVSCLGVNQGPPATTEGVSCKGAAGLGGASCTLVCGQGAHRGAQALPPCLPDFAVWLLGCPGTAIQPAACRHLPAWGTLCSPGRWLLRGLQAGAAPPGLQEHRGPCLPTCTRRWLLRHHPTEEETDSKCQRNSAKDVHGFRWGLNLGLLDTRL